MGKLSQTDVSAPLQTEMMSLGIKLPNIWGNSEQFDFMSCHRNSWPWFSHFLRAMSFVKKLDKEI